MSRHAAHSAAALLGEQRGALTELFTPLITPVGQRALAAAGSIVSAPDSRDVSGDDVTAEKLRLVDDYAAAQESFGIITPGDDRAFFELQKCLDVLAAIANRGLAIATFQSDYAVGLIGRRGQLGGSAFEDENVAAELERLKVLRGVVIGIRDLFSGNLNLSFETSPTNLVRQGSAAGFEVVASGSVFACRASVPAVLGVALGIQGIFTQWHHVIVADRVEEAFLSPGQVDLAAALEFSAFAAEVRRGKPITKLVLSESKGDLHISVRMALADVRGIFPHEFFRRYCDDLARIDRAAAVLGMAPAHQSLISIAGVGADTDPREVRLEYTIAGVAKGHAEAIPGEGDLKWFDKLAESGSRAPKLLHFVAPPTTNQIAVAVARNAIADQQALERILYALPKFCRLNGIEAANVRSVLRPDDQNSIPCVILNLKGDDVMGRPIGEFTVDLSLISRSGICEEISNLSQLGIEKQVAIFDAWGAEFFDFALKMGRAVAIVTHRFECEPSDLTLSIHFDSKTSTTGVVPFSIAIKGYDIPVLGTYVFAYRSTQPGEIHVEGNLRLSHVLNRDLMRLPDYLVSSLNAVFQNLPTTHSKNNGSQFLRTEMAKRTFVVPLWLCRQLEPLRKFDNNRRPEVIKKLLGQLLEDGKMKWRKDGDDVRLYRPRA